MKKTAIVSCYFQHNYGSMLQAYATQMVLDKLGYENETIDISGFDGEIKKAKILYFIKASLTSDILITKIGRAKDAVVRKLKKNNYTRNVEARDEAFRRFKKEHFEMSPAYSFHCSAFSIQYEKNFFTFRRFSNTSRQSTNSRLETLFNMTGIEDRLIVGNENIKKILTIKTDYSLVRERLRKNIEESYKYLTAALENQRSTDL